MLFRSPELLGSGKGTKRRPNRESAPLRTTRVPEPEQLRPGKYRQPRAGHGWFPAEQPKPKQLGQRGYTRHERGADPVWLRHCEHTPVLFVCSIPPYLPSARLNNLSLIKKKKKCPPPSPLCQGGNQTLKRQQTEAITEGTALEATGNRLKPCGYYQLHRKGPIDLEKYKSDQGTSQK